MFFKFDLGVTVTEVITGFKGVITGRAQYLTGCNQYAVCPVKLKKDGTRPDWDWIDENRLVQNAVKRLTLPDQDKSTRGFDGSHPNKK